MTKNRGYHTEIDVCSKCNHIPCYCSYVSQVQSKAKHIPIECDKILEQTKDPIYSNTCTSYNNCSKSIKDCNNKHKQKKSNNFNKCHKCKKCKKSYHVCNNNNGCSKFNNKNCIPRRNHCGLGWLFLLAFLL